MVFSSAIFLFVFFPAVFVLYRVVPGIPAKNMLLILASLVFYSFGQPQYLLLLLLSVLVHYVSGLLLCSRAAAEGPRAGTAGTWILALTVVFDLGILGIFKYLDFTVNNVNQLLGTQLPLPGITLPIGISFFTFQGLSYAVDVYRDRTQGTRSFFHLLLYISFFPQLIAGPIVKYHDVSRMIEERRTTPELTASGLRRFIMGLSKKLLVANTAGAVADQVFGLDAGILDFRLAWLGAVCYSLQIYFDFSGYSDMAIGLGRIFGFRFLENFNYPYVSRSIQEFWRRWHISLSSWFRDYLYIPLGGSFCSRARGNRNRLIVFFTTGLWHGASWTFVLWGLWHGMFLILENEGIIPVKKMQRTAGGRAFAHLYVLLVVVLGFTLFRAESLGQAGMMFSAMFTGFQSSAETAVLLQELLTPSTVFWILAGMVLSVDLLPRLRRCLGVRDDRLVDDGPGVVRCMEDGSLAEPWQQPALQADTAEGRKAKAAEFLASAGALLLLVLCILNLSQTGYNPFIYFQF